MPEKKTKERAQRAKRRGKAASTQAGEFVREEMHHIREGKHGARSTKQAIAIGLSKARRAGVDLEPPEKGTTSERTRKQAKRDVAKGKRGSSTRPKSRKRSRAVSHALDREGRSAASKKALSRQARAAASNRRAIAEDLSGTNAPAFRSICCSYVPPHSAAASATHRSICSSCFCRVSSEKLRASPNSRTSAGMMLRASPPEMSPMFAVVSGSMRPSRMRLTAFAAISTALTPRSGSMPAWAALPRSTKSTV